MKKLFSLLLVATHAFAGLPPTTIQGQNDTSAKTKFAFQVPNNQATDLGGIKALIETGSDDVLANPTFQATGVSSSVVPSWTLAGAGVTAGVSTSPTFGNDPQVLQLTLSSATGDLLSQDVTPKSTASFAGINLENSMWVYAPTSGVTLQVCARLSGSDVSGACVSVPNIGGWAYVPASSVGGSGSAGVSLFASASSTGTVYVTHGYVGRNRNLSNATPITAWSTGLSLTPNGFGTVTSQVYETRQVGDSMEVRGYFTTGTAAGTTASISLPSGYTIDSNKLGSGTNGTMLGLITRQTSSTNSNFSGNLSAYIFYDGSTTDRVFISNQSSGLAFVKSTGSGYAGNTEPQTFDFKVPISQLAASVPIASMANVSANWGGYQTVASGWTTTSTTYVDPSSGTTIATTAAGTPHNISCVTNASSKAGIDCTIPRAGSSNYRVCAYVNASNSSATGFSARVVDGSGTIINPGLSMQETAGGAMALFPLCGPYTASTTSPTFKVQTAAPSGTVTVQNGLASGSAAIVWSVEQIDSSVPTPLAMGNVSSTTTGQEHIERAQIGATGSACTSTPCTITSQSGSWLTAVTRSAVGNYSISVAPNEFSAPPTCYFTSISNTAGLCSTQSPTSTTIPAFCVNSTTGSGADEAFQIICMGPH